MKSLLRMALLCAAVAFAGKTAYADIIFQIGNNPQQDDENIAFNGPGAIALGNPVTGNSNQTATQFLFTSDEVLITPTSSRIESVDNSFNFLMIESAAGAFFQSAIFNLDAVTTGTVNFSVMDDLGQFATQIFGVAGTGQNFFTITANGSQFMQRITIAGADLSQVSQVRIGGIASQPVQVPVPEASTGLLLGSGLLFIAAVVRFRSRDSRQ